jgi:ATP-binding cassette subfamily B protein
MPIVSVSFEVSNYLLLFVHMKLLYTYLTQHKKLLALTLLLATVNQVFSLLDPQFFRLIIDNFASHPEQFTVKAFITGVLLLLAGSVSVALVSRITKNFQDYYTNIISLRVGARLYTDTIAHAFSLPYGVFEDERSGELLQKIRQSRDNSQALIAVLIGMVFVSFVGLIFVIIYALTVHWSIGLVYIVMIPIVGFSAFVIGRKIKAIQSSVVKETAALAGSTTETIRNIELVKSLGLEHQEVSRLNFTNDQILQLEFKKQKSIRYLSFVQGTIINAIRAGLLLLMVWLVYTKAITVGELFSLYIYSFFVFGPLQEFGNIATKYYETKASLEAVENFRVMPSAPKPENPVRIDHIETIVFKNVSFKYETAPTDTVSDISLSVKAGETIAFVGPSGSGKSTLIKLLTSLYSPNSGTISINNVSLETIDVDTLRERIGLVLQDTQLFAGTIRDNLVFVDDSATDAACLDALRRAQALPLIERSGLGLDTRIGEGGLKLSGGERQRLAIARALLRKPEILIFDEATSALDSITEHAITETIKDISKTEEGITKVLVAHRLSTIIHADKIFVLEKGKIVESGDHRLLLAKKGLYAALWREQQGEQA